MNTALLKTFGQKARTLLIDGVNRKLAYWGFATDGTIAHPLIPLVDGYRFRGDVFDGLDVPRKWTKLKEVISADGFTEVAERAAYIWFNRLMAIKILGCNGYDLPMLEPVSAEEATPRLLKRARAGSYEFLTTTETVRLRPLLTEYEKEKEAFGILLIGWCHSHPLLNRVFGAIDDYTELLLPDDILTPAGFLDVLNNGGYITDDDYKQVEMIGWLYQFYISEKKDAVFKKFKDGKKAEAADIPAATQIFTPAWIVKYMVQNTVGRIWLEKNPASTIKAGLEYLVENATGNEPPEPIVAEVTDLKLLDPAVGSGHILVEGFDLLYHIYKEEYYTTAEAVESILRHNLWGLDIDLRAAGLAQFAVLLKAAQHHPDVLKDGLLPHIYAMPAPVHFTKEDVQLFLGGDGAAYAEPLQKALHLMLGAQNLGSIMRFELSDEARAFILVKRDEWQSRADLDLEEQALFVTLKPYLNVLEVLAQSYEAIAANPPYMGDGNMNGILKMYVNKHYPYTKNDLYAVFMEVCYGLLKKAGRYGMINQQSWMFLGSYKNFRYGLLQSQAIENMIHLGPKTFDEIGGEVVQNTAFVISKRSSNNSKAHYYRLVTYRDSESKRNAFKKRQNEYKKIDQATFYQISGTPLAYWITSKVIDIFSTSKSLDDVGFLREGIHTASNETFLRRWFEISVRKFTNEAISDLSIDLNKKKWIPYNKGGTFRRWYGNNDLVICFDCESRSSMEALKGHVRPSKGLYYKSGGTWSALSSGKFGIRYYPDGFLFDSKGQVLVTDNGLFEIIGYMNSVVAQQFYDILMPTLDYKCGDVKKTPYMAPSEIHKEAIAKIALSNIELSQIDWNSRETSWDFQSNPLLNTQPTLKQSCHHWVRQSSEEFFQLHKNEEELNHIFINIYGLEDELQPDVALEDITILQDELDYEELKKLQPPYEGQLLPIKKEMPIQQLISYTIGCFMGRYRLGKPGLHIAHPAPTSEELAPYNYTSPSTSETHFFEIDEDGIIPLMGNRGAFPDDAVARLQEFLRFVWGEEPLIQNINFMQEALAADLDDWVVKKFWAYHVRTYSKKPIYWLFSSKRGAFQALVYMHRMNRFTAEKLRDKYLIKHIQYLRQEIEGMEKGGAAASRTEARKLDGLRAALAECNEYDLLLKQVATEQIEFDLDDGVTKNYALFKTVVAPVK